MVKLQLKFKFKINRKHQTFQPFRTGPSENTWPVRACAKFRDSADPPPPGGSIALFPGRSKRCQHRGTIIIILTCNFVSRFALMLRFCTKLCNGTPASGRCVLQLSTLPGSTPFTRCFLRKKLFHGTDANIFLVCCWLPIHQRVSFIIILAEISSRCGLIVCWIVNRVRKDHATQRTFLQLPLIGKIQTKL